MKNFVVLALSLFMSLSAVSATVDIDVRNLDPEQVAQLQLQAAKMAKEKTQIGAPTTPEELTQWVNFGTAIGQGLSSTAKELGVAADEIADTKVGKFAMVMIAWHYIGDDIVGVFFGFTWLFTMVPTWVWFFRRLNISEIVYHKEGPIKKEVKFNKQQSDDGMRFVYWLTLLIICAVGIITIVVA